MLLSYPEHFISRFLAAHKLVTTLTRARNVKSTLDIEGGNSYYINITLGGQIFLVMIDTGRYALYICSTPSIFGVIRLFTPVQNSSSDL